MGRRRRTLLSGRSRPSPSTPGPEASSDRITPVDPTLPEAPTPSAEPAVPPEPAAPAAPEPPPASITPPVSSAPVSPPAPKRPSLYEPPEPGSAPPPQPADPVVPEETEPLPFHERSVDGSLPEEVIETSYVAAGADAIGDTTDSGWDDARDSKTAIREDLEPPPDLAPPPAPPPVTRRAESQDRFRPNPPTPQPPRKPAESPRTPAPTPRPGGQGAQAPSFDDAPKPFGSTDQGTGTYYPGFGVVEEEAATVPYSSAFSSDFDEASFADMDAPPPPTDEVPSAVLQDVSQSYAAPMNVPEPPPIPGLLDRFTPVGAPSRAQHDPDRPSYLADDEPPKPPPMKLRPTPTRNLEEDDEEPRRGSPVPFLIGGALFFGGAVLLLVLVFVLLLQNNTPDAGPVTPPVPAQVEPVTPGPDAIDVPVKDDLKDPEPAPVPAPEPEPAPTPAPVRPAPERPRPQPAPAPVAPAPAEARGTLSIRSNRMALVYVDGRALGLTPKTVKEPAGTRTISAMLPGQPQSKQTKSVKVVGGRTATVEFTF